MDFTQAVAPVASMDDADDLIERLCTMAAMIMEDAAPIALVRDPDQLLVDRIAEINRAGVDIISMAQAAEVVARRFGKPDPR